MSNRHSQLPVGRVARPLAVAISLAIALVAGPVRLLAHAHLTKSVPSSGARLAGSPTSVSVWFSEAPELAFTRITLVGPDSVHIALGEIQRAPGESLAIEAAVPSQLTAGEYTVVWQTAADDGHPSRGSFSFEVLSSSSPAAPEASLPNSRAQTSGRSAQGVPNGMDGGTSAASGIESPAYVAVRWLSFVALIALIGVTVFRWLVLPRAVRIADRHARGPVLRAALNALMGRAAGLGAIPASALPVAAAARLYVQSAAMHDYSNALGAVMTRQTVARTHWGRAWLAQVLLAIVVLLSLGATRRTQRHGVRERRVAWTIAAAAVVVLAFTPALAGHAAATPRLTMLAIALDGVHILAAGGWLGALLILLTIGLPEVLASGLPERGGVVTDLVNACSPAALAFATLVVLTGLVAAWLHLGNVAALWGSTYGRTLLIKLGALVPVLGTGAYNWRRVRPALGDITAAGRLRRSAAAELTVGAVVIAVTAVLVAVQPPS